MEDIRSEETVAVDSLDERALKDFLAGHNISLTLAEVDRVRELIGRNPTIVELHIFNTMWSEHCSYKSSKAVLKEFLPTEAPHVVLGPGEDAGVIRFLEKDGKTHCLVMAHESHNHPSQVLPVEGAATGIGGIVRDVYCMGADVIGVMDPLRFGDPDGPNARRVRDIVRGVVDGIAQYGNALGVPNYGGDTYFDGRFDDNCLVNVVAIGAVLEEDIIRSRAPNGAAASPHDVILIGKPTDASGFGGAAFASERLSGDQAEERQEAVQVPDPFLKRVLVEATKVVLATAKEKGIPIGFKDLGAGGISCAVSEMAQAAGVGAHVDLDQVNSASDRLAPEVIACSETQERYAMIVPAAFTQKVLEIYNDVFDMPHLYTGAGACVIGKITAEKDFKLAHRSRLVCDASVDAITTGIQYDRPTKRRTKPLSAGGAPGAAPPIKEALLSLLSAYNIADKSILYRHYDSEVQGRAVLRPGEADAAVALFLPDGLAGVAAAIGGNPRLGAVDPYLGGAWAVCEAVRNVACVGAVPLAVTDCLNYGDPEDPAVFWEFKEGVRGIGDACRGLRVYGNAGNGIPVISGNVSFYNQSGKGDPIPPSPVVACVGRVDDVSACCGLGFAKAGSKIVLLGTLEPRLGGSEYAAAFAAPAGAGSMECPEPHFEKESAIAAAVLQGIRIGAVLSAHDIGHGGLLVSLAEMILGSAPRAVGCAVTVRAGNSPVESLLFSEYGGILVEVDAGRWPELQTALRNRGAPWLELGDTVERPSLGIRLPEETIEVEFDALDAAYNKGSRCNPLFA